MQILLGGLITLTVTTLVQILIIPMVQRRTRRLERWEEDLVKLVTMHDEEMGILVSRHAGAAIQHAYAEDQLQRGVNGVTQEDVDKAHQEVVDAWDATQELWHKVLLLRNRVYLVSKGAPHWSWMERVTWDFSTALGALSPHPSQLRAPLDHDEKDSSTTRLSELYDGVGEVIHKVSDTMRPPPTYPWRRWWILMRWHARRLTGTLNPAPEPYDTEAALARMWEESETGRAAAGELSAEDREKAEID